MTAKVLSPAQANLKLALWEVESNSISNSNLYVWLVNSGLPDEIAIRLYDLTTYSKKVGSKVISVGKIILLKIIDFIKEHPYLSIGVALGVAIGLLVNSVPFIGSLLSPLATALGITIGAIAGHRLDKRTQGKEIYGTGIIEITEEVIEIAKLFFEFFIDVFTLIFNNVVTA